MEAQSRWFSQCMADFFFFFSKCYEMPSLFVIKLRFLTYYKTDFSFLENFRALVLICSNPISLSDKRVWIYVSNFILMALNISYWLKKCKHTLRNSPQMHASLNCTLEIFYRKFLVLKNYHFMFIFACS